mmetsp:Transcript_85154/g.260211  ORF Transcript_85154/g.260211 Transcript_85154/m.260211 type:complete len:328 (+) Transcript_85154:2795-3778(+)
MRQSLDHLVDRASGLRGGGKEIAAHFQVNVGNGRHFLRHALRLSRLLARLLGIERPGCRQETDFYRRRPLPLRRGRGRHRHGAGSRPPVGLVCARVPVGCLLNRGLVHVLHLDHELVHCGHRPGLRAGLGVRPHSLPARARRHLLAVLVPALVGVDVPLQGLRLHRQAPPVFRAVAAVDRAVLGARDARLGVCVALVRPHGGERGGHVRAAGGEDHAARGQGACLAGWAASHDRGRRRDAHAAAATRRLAQCCQYERSAPASRVGPEVAREHFGGPTVRGGDAAPPGPVDSELRRRARGGPHRRARTPGDARRRGAAPAAAGGDARL